MSPFVIFGILLAIAISCLALGYKLGPALSARLAKRETARMAEFVEILGGQLKRTTAERNDFERRAEENRKTIEAVLKERDGWQELYDKQSIGHGNAQAIMMDAIGFLEQKLKVAGVTVELPAIVRQTQDLYTVAHVLPAVERSGYTVVHGQEREPNSAPASGKVAP